MRKIVAIFLFSLFFHAFSCKKDKKKELPATIYVNGIVTDKQTTAPLDSVSVTITNQANSIGSLPLPLMNFSTGPDGKYNFEFSPKPDYIYELSFDKTKSGYKWTSLYIDKYEEYQIFNVALEK